MAVSIVTKRLDPEARSSLILEQALRLFAERHYSVVTVRDIAVACKIQNGLIYYYFTNKDHLLRAALAYAIDKIRQTYQPAEHLEPNSGDALLSWLRGQVSISPMLKSMNKVMADYAASSTRDEITDRLITDFYAGEQALLEAHLQRAVDQGVFQPMDVTKVARSISLQLDGIFFSATCRGDNRIAHDIDDLCALITLFARQRP